ncbi:alpha/beta fold hydrolase [uncultured Microbacterium sp.]|uniref:alpha/beta fold hydrolase n=1 Tax=uncultured Microbacterium sp. TaxID=191216 RepID=UPI00261DDB45|nr:alpha/beta fold hydrolase [uncultured Microbacterium sp.]
MRRVLRPADANGPAFTSAYVRTGPRTPHPTVVIPGGPGLGSILPYRALRRRAAQGGLDVIMIDHRGVGFSRDDRHGRRLPQSAMRIRDVVDDIAAVLDAEGVERAYIAGSSYGSYLAGSFGAQHPTRVAGMLLDSALQSTDDMRIEREIIRAHFWDADTAVASAVHALAAEGVPDRPLLDGIRAAFELGGDDLVIAIAEAKLRHPWSAVWRGLGIYAARDESIIRIPGFYEFDTVGAIGFRELGYGGEADGLPLDPALTYARLADRFPPFSGAPYDLTKEIAAFDWPLVALSGRRDLRTPPVIAQRAVDTAPDGVLVEIENGHSALDMHPLAFLNAVRALVHGTQHRLPALEDRLDALPLHGLSANLPRVLRAGAGIERMLPPAPWR